MTYHPINRKG